VRRWWAGAGAADVACLGGLAAGVVLSYAVLAATPSLLAHHTMVLEVLAGSVVSMVTAGALASVGHLSLVLALLAPLAGVAIYDAFYWWAGRRYGNAILGRWARTPRSRRRLARAERLVARWGVGALVFEYYLPVPNAIVQLLTGTSGMRLRTFLLADIAGSLLWAALIVGLGYAIGRPAVRIADTVSHDALIATLALLAALLAVAVLRARSRARRV
jgi:membrane-associated protein